MLSAQEKTGAGEWGQAGGAARPSIWGGGSDTQGWGRRDGAMACEVSRPGWLQCWGQGSRVGAGGRRVPDEQGLGPGGAAPHPCPWGVRTWTVTARPSLWVGGSAGGGPWAQNRPRPQSFPVLSCFLSSGAPPDTLTAGQKLTASSEFSHPDAWACSGVPGAEGPPSPTGLGSSPSCHEGGRHE